MITLQFKEGTSSRWMEVKCKYHMLSGRPACQSNHNNGKRKSKEYFEHGCRHRLGQTNEY